MKRIMEGKGREERLLIFVSLKTISVGFTTNNSKVINQ